MSNTYYYVYSTTGSDYLISDLGKVVPPGAENKIDLYEYFTSIQISESEDLISAISNGYLILNDGTQNLSIGDAIIYTETITDHKHPATDIDVDTTNFDGKLSSADDTIQKSLDTLDDHTHDVSEYTGFLEQDEEIRIKVYIQALEPTLAANKNIAIWEDTSQSKVFLVYKDSSGSQKTVELQ